jgi:hypothetical protein
MRDDDVYKCHVAQFKPRRRRIFYPSLAREARG